MKRFLKSANIDPCIDIEVTGESDAGPRWKRICPMQRQPHRSRLVAEAT